MCRNIHKIDKPITHIDDHSFSWFGTYSAIKRGGVSIKFLIELIIIITKHNMTPTKLLIERGYIRPDAYSHLRRTCGCKLSLCIVPTTTIAS